jgi:alkylation response protein AidB-like acyl-CoA dehydrogenase
MSYALTDDQQLVQQDASDFSQQYLAPAASMLDRGGAYPSDIIGQMAQHDFFGLFLGDDVGGAGAGYLSYVLVVEALASASAAVSSILVNHSAAAYAIQTWGSDAQKKQYLPSLAAGTTLGAVALAEDGPKAGIGPNAVMATKTGDGYSLTGTKPCVANAGQAGTYVVFAATAPNVGEKAWSAFVVEAKTPGLTVGAQIENMGLHGRPTADLRFDKVAVSAGALLGQLNGGAAIAQQLAAVTGIAEAAQTVAVARTGINEAAKYAAQRKQFERPIDTFQAIQSLIARVAENCHLARLAIYDAASLVEKGKPFATEAAIVKAVASRIGFEALVDAVQVEGGYGYSEDMPLARLYRDIPGTLLRDEPDAFPERIVSAALTVS